MHRGYIKLWRRSFDSAIWENPKLWRFWTYCLMKATHKETSVMVGFQQIHLKKGQFVFGRKIASKETGLSEQTIRTCLQKLNGSKLTIKTTNKFTVITIDKWDIFQTEEKNQPANQPSSNQQVTTYKNDKNNKKKKGNGLFKIPEEIPETEWNNYMQVRARIKCANTEAAKKLLVNKLLSFKEKGHCLKTVLNSATENSWKSVYEPKHLPKGEFD